MTNENLYELLGSISEAHIQAARDYRRKPAFLWRSIIAACVCLVIAASSVIRPSAAQPADRTSDAVPAPMLIINGSHYFAPDAPVDELPAGYHYLRDLTAAEAYHTQLAGCAVYVDPQDADMRTLYLYQECGTPVGENAVDNEKRQWAYVKWTASEPESDGAVEQHPPAG